MSAPWILLLALALIAGAGVGAAGMARRWLPRLRAVVRQWRASGETMTTLDAHMELAYQFHVQVQTPALPANQHPNAFDGGQWTLVAGQGKGWAADTFYKVRGLAIHQQSLYASLTGPKADGPLGQVWRIDQEGCTQVGGSLSGSWPADASFVDHLHSKNPQTLLAAEKTGVWQYATGAWSALREGLQLSEKSGPYCFTEWNGQTVMGQWGDPKIALLSDSGAWSYLPPPEGGWGEGVRTIYCLAVLNGKLYAGTGTGRLHGEASAVWQFDGRHWEKVGGSGIRGSWARQGVPFVLSLTVFGERLIATLSRPANTPASASNVWVFDGERWGPLGVGAIPALMAQSLIMNDALVFKNHLVVATGHGHRRPAQLWVLDSAGHWRAFGPPELDLRSSEEGGWWVYRLCTDGENLYASTAGHRGAAAVFRFTPAGSGHAEKGSIT